MLRLLTQIASRARPLLVCLALAAQSAAGQSGDGQTAAALSKAGALTPFTPCRIEHPARVASFKAECAWLTVPENRDRPKGRQIRLHIARVPAISARKQPDPLLVLAGGPGMAANVMYASTAPAFSRINQDRDVLLIDQRGTGLSAPLECPFDEQDTFSADETRMLELVMACRDALSKNADLAQYTTSVAVRDLEAARIALGLGAINLYGVSYGTRVAQHYLRRYPANTRRVILDGVVAPDAVLPEGIALDAESALLQILGRCKADARCAERFKDPVADYRVVRARVAERPVALSVPDPRTGEIRAVNFDRYYLAAVLRLASYTPQSAALLPLALWQAARQEDFRALAAQALLVSRPLQNVMAMGMHNSVMCAEDDPRIDSRPIDRNKLATTYIGTVQLDAIRKLCAGWPRGPVDDDLFTSVSSTVPVLLLSGGADPVTPPAYALRAMTKLSNARHIEVPAMGHGQLGLPCMSGLMAEFIDGVAPQALDAKCLERVRPMPFFLSPAGPAP